MGNVLRDFGNYFRGTPEPTVPTAPIADAVDPPANAQDYERFFSTGAVAELEMFIQNEIDANMPKPEEGMDAAAARSFKQSGLMVAQRKLRSMRAQMREIQSGS